MHSNNSTIVYMDNATKEAITKVVDPYCHTIKYNILQ